MNCVYPCDLFTEDCEDDQASKSHNASSNADSNNNDDDGDGVDDDDDDNLTSSGLCPHRGETPEKCNGGGLDVIMERQTSANVRNAGARVDAAAIAKLVDSGDVHQLKSLLAQDNSAIDDFDQVEMHAKSLNGASIVE